jgi:hypothetical protein
VICLLISLISAVRKLLLWLGERRQSLDADLPAKHDERTLLFYFVEAGNLSQALQQECNCRFAATASILKLFAEAIEL